jgi:hypothetical protein
LVSVAQELRLRPLERPAWVELPLGMTERRVWRERAAACGLALDAWLAILAEVWLVRGEIGPLVAADDLLGQAVSRQLPTTPPAALATWVRQLHRARCGETAPLADDLPSVALPGRLVARLPRPLLGSLRAAVRSVGESDAIALELAASARGMTIEVFAYLSAVRARASG